MKKNQLDMIVLTWCKQVPITYVYCHETKILNRRIRRCPIFLLLLGPFSPGKKHFKNNLYGIFQQLATIYTPNVFNALYCKIRLVRLCPVFADPVTYAIQVLSTLCAYQYNVANAQRKQIWGKVGYTNARTTAILIIKFPQNGRGHC